MSYQDFFKGKKVTVMGLGLLGRGVGDAEFLARHGAELLVTDLKSEKDLATSLLRLKQYTNIRYRLGEHQLEDFRNKDFIVKAAGVPLESPFIEEAKKNNVSVEMDASLFLKLAPKVTCIGVTGTRGKSTTSAMIYEILKLAGKRAFLAGNIKDTATLPLLEKIQEGDFIVLELDSWQLQGFGDSKISPHIAVFTTFLPDHMNYYKGDMNRYFEDKALIFRNQNEGDYLVVGEDIADKYEWNTKGEVRVAKRADLSGEWLRLILGEHNRLNASCAKAVADILKIPSMTTRKAINSFHGLAGRLELRRMVDGVAYYNDSNSTTPDATIVGLRAVGSEVRKKVVLIIGGDDKQLDMSALVDEIPKWCSKVVLFKERGTDRIRNQVFALEKQGVQVFEEEGLENTLKRAKSIAAKGDVVLYSPAFSSFGKYFKNEYDRGEQFNKILAAF